MEFFLANKRLLVLFGIVFFLATLFLIASFFLFRSPQAPEQNLQNNLSPTQIPSPNPSSTEFYDPYSPEYKKSMDEIRKQEEQLYQRNLQVAAFIDTLPQIGYNFTAAYDIQTNSVIVTIPSSRRVEGEREFDTYLRANGIENRSWIQNLTIRYQNSDPDAH